MPLCLERWALANHARGQERTQTFLLQMTVEGAVPELSLTFRTLGGNVAASIKWNSRDPTTGLPAAVLGGIKGSGLECSEPHVSNLRLLKPDGTPVDVRPDAPPLAEQLASHMGQ